MMPNPTLTPINFRGLVGYCTGWASDMTGTVYVSLVGRKTALAGIWAAFMSHEVLPLGDITSFRKRIEPDTAHYHTLRAYLPETGWQQWVLLYSQATVGNLPDEDFFVVSGQPEPPLDRFWAQWNQALLWPAKPAWVNRLWPAGLATGLIIAYPAQGIYCWRVGADREEWTGIIRAIVTGAEVAG
jgi:hypothetical protein